MCDPVSIAVGGAAGLSLIDEFNANENRKNSNKLKDEAVALHKEVFANKLEGVGNSFRGNQVQSGEAKQQRNIEGMKARALSQVGASASGVQGLSVDAVLDDFTRQVGTGNSTIDQSLDLQKNASNTAIKGLGLGTQGALFNLRKETFNPINSALRIGRSAFGGFTGVGGGKNSPRTPTAENPVATNTGQTFGPTRTDFIK